MSESEWGGGGGEGLAHHSLSMVPLSVSIEM